MVNRRATSVSQPTDVARSILRLLRAHATAEHTYRSAIARALDITTVEATALAYVLADCLTPDALAHELDLSPGGIIALMQRLENRGHGSRVADHGEPPSLVLRPSARVERGSVPCSRRSPSFSANSRPGSASLLQRFLPKRHWSSPTPQRPSRATARVGQAGDPAADGHDVPDCIRAKVDVLASILGLPRHVMTT
jgi:hypothetical protein